jgi:hypothetical protein
MRRCLAICIVLVAASATGVSAQPVPAPAAAAPAAQAARQALLRSRWDAALAKAAADRQMAISAGVITLANGTPAPATRKTEVYRAAFEALPFDPMLASFFAPDPKLVDEVTPEAELALIKALADSAAGEKGAKSVNAASTNPSAPKVAERSGFTDLVALALDSQNFVSADKTAVSLSLNALALVGLKSKTLSAPAAYRRHDGLRRLGGTATFGAKIPEKEITGLSGLPTADTLFDVFSWDVKVRVIGDRDPRAQRWFPLMLGDLGGLGEIATIILSGSFVPVTELTILQPALNDSFGVAVLRAKTLVSKSLQVSVKAAGQHLTTQKGKNKYSFAVLGDQGFGDTDLTFNVLYSSVDDVSAAPASELFTVKTWSGAVAINTLVAKDALVQGRATELSLNARVDVPVDKSALPIERENIWNVVGAVTLPWGDAAKIPVSITFTNDPNNLKKQKYVSGYIGVSYDFGALKSLFKPQTK